MRSLVLTAIAMASVALSSATLSGGESRVYVQFAPGGKGAVKSSVVQLGGRIHYEFDHLGAMAVTLPDPALNGLRNNPNVLLIEEDPVRNLYGQTVPYGINMVEAPQAVAAGGTGAGFTVGVIDSGLFTGHEDFAGVAMAGEPGGDPATDERAWNRDRNSHGTHVTGTIVAVDNSLGVIGVSPGQARIYMVKVFGDAGTWIYSSTLLQAVQNAVNNGGAKIINMSLGGTTQSTTENKGMQALYDQGVLLVAAAGNSGNTQTSYPAGYASVISVAAIDSAKVVASFSQKNATVEIAAPGVGVLSTTSYRNAGLSVGTSSYIASALDGTMFGTASAALVDGGRALSTNAAWAGKTVLVERGDISFWDKVLNVQNSGGVACIIYNNVAGGFSGTLGTGNTSTIPALTISREDGLELLGKLGQTANSSTVPSIDTSGYEYFDGTSMATPHVAGVASLIWSKHPTATNAKVRQALQETAEDLGTAGRDNSYGYGLVRAKAAMDRLGALTAGDTTAPVISSVTSVRTNTKNGSFEIRWTTNELATSDVRIGSTDYLDPDPALVTSHVRGFRGSKGVTYTYYVRSADAAGNTTGWVGPYTHNN